MSTGAVYETGFDTRFGPPARSTADYPSSRGRPYYAQPSSRQSLDPSQATSAPYPPYGTRPRRNSSTEPSSRAPLGLLSPEPYNRPLVRTLDTPRTSAPKIYMPKDESAGVVYPASSRRNHLRHNSSTTEDFSRLSLAERERSERQRSVHRNSYVGAQRSYNAAQAARYPAEDEYSYTGPREQFERDYPPRQPRPRPEGYARAERPVSMIDHGDSKSSNSSRREPPPSSVKHFDRLERGDSRRPGSGAGIASDNDRDLDRVSRRDSARHPVSVHQYERDDGYYSQRDEHHDRLQPIRHERPVYDDDRYTSDRDRHHRHSHHERRSSKSRNDWTEGKEHSSLKPALTVAGLSAVAAAALKESRDDKKDKDADYDKEARREKERKRRERDLEGEAGERDRRSEKIRERPAEMRYEPDIRRGPEQAKAESDDGTDKHRRRRRHKERTGAEGGSGSGSDHHGAGRDDTATDDGKEGHRRRRHRHHRHRERDVESKDYEIQGKDDVAFVESPVEIRNEEPRARKTVTVVEPTKDEVPEIKPKGILKPPREAFPEDPNPTREGVAPLKDAGKKGIPPGARWTKINRLLVNPAALIASQERFEERDDYVIVLRVLSREDVQRLADKTREIRGMAFTPPRKIFANSILEAREREDRGRATQESDRQVNPDDGSDSDSDISSSDSYLSEDGQQQAYERGGGQRRESEVRERPLALESAPPQPPTLLNQFQQAAGQAEPSAVPVAATAPPPPRPPQYPPQTAPQQPQ